MKKGLLIILLCFTTILSFGAIEKKVYLIMPENIDIDGTSYNGGQTDTGYIDKGNTLIYGMVSKGKLKKININKIEVYEDEDENAQLVEIVVKASNNKAEIKLAMSYKISGKDKYVILTDTNITLGTLAKIKGNYESNNFSSKDLIDPTSDKSDYDYDSFPGYKIIENTRVFNAVIGDKKVSDPERSRPSNITEKLEKTQEIITEGDIRVNPGNHFVFKDENNNLVTSSDLKETLIREKPDGKFIYYEGEAKYLYFKVIGGATNIDVNGEPKTLASGSTHTYANGVKWLEVVNANGHGNGHWYISLIKEESSIIPEEVFIITGVGDVLEANINMTSGKEESRSRESNIEIDVLGGKGIEIKSIKE